MNILKSVAVLLSVAVLSVMLWSPVEGRDGDPDARGRIDRVKKATLKS